MGRVGLLQSLARPSPFNYRPGPYMAHLYWAGVMLKFLNLVSAIIFYDFIYGVFALKIKFGSYDLLCPVRSFSRQRPYIVIDLREFHNAPLVECLS